MAVQGRGEGVAEVGLQAVVVEVHTEVAGQAPVGFEFDGVLEPAGLLGVLSAVDAGLLGGGLGGEARAMLGIGLFPGSLRYAAMGAASWTRKRRRTRRGV
ncbi:hypothetical protein GCM10012285_24210 [Streptomyces kronopolitis]|uniref:Uncharacterized protein n=1 Tax=Streptomyces kronopolitis TaxID=1612435 RepID=A0ABQ2JAU3_9ACTN|nr:hypothetical protein GCM10012285_24210 [Streptomyces kronopolitis]